MSNPKKPATENKELKETQTETPVFREGKQVKSITEQKEDKDKSDKQ